MAARPDFCASSKATSTAASTAAVSAVRSLCKMEPEEAMGLALLIIAKNRKCKNRRFWIHPLLQDRSVKGSFATLYLDLRRNQEKFFTFTRMSLSSFDELLQLLEEGLQGNNSVRDCVPPEEKLIVTLKYLASGCSMTDLHLYFRLGLSTVSSIIQLVCEQIWFRMKTLCLAVPTLEEWKGIAEGFNKRANFPHCVGALDGKHIRIIRPEHSGSMFFNYKHFFSVVLLAMCDANYLFTYVDIGAYGKESDSSVFKNSVLSRAIAINSLNLPEAEPLSETLTENMPYVILADEAFALTDHVMRPYSRASLTKTRKIYNYRHSRGRRFIECAFGILSNKWRIFHRPLNVRLSLAVDIIKACCILHNFVRRRDGYNFEECLTVEGLTNLRPDNVRGSNAATSIRDKFADYFVSDEGMLPWQDRAI